MTTLQLINLLVTVTLISMMVTVGMGVTFSAIAGAAKNWRVVARAVLANYVLFPAAVVVLLVLFHAKEMVAAGFLILAVCPGAPFGPPITALAKGNVAVSVGLMVILAASSVFVAPALLVLLLPRVTGSGDLHVDVARMVGTLLISQLLPLLAGLLVRYWRPALAARLKKPFDVATRVLGLLAVVLVTAAQYRTLSEVKLTGLAAMLAMWLLSILFGWFAGDSRDGSRSAVAETTSLRNVGVAMVIASSSFSGTAALPAVVAYGLVSILASVLAAVVWAKWQRASGRPGAPAPTSA
jgi:BASS family bile acid:Na+ symporter